MRYCKATYRRSKKYSKGILKIYTCTGGLSKKGLENNRFRCSGKLAFELIKKGHVYLEAKGLKKYRLHSERCEFSKFNTDLIAVADKDDSELIEKKKRKRTQSRSSRSESNENLEEIEAANQASKVLSNSHQESASSNSSENEGPASSNSPMNEGPASSNNEENEAPEEGEQDSELNICRICKIGEDGRKMIGCDRCSHWLHLVCEQVTDQEAEEDPWYCSVCREPDLENAHASESSEAQNKDETERNEFLYQTLNGVDSFFDRLIEERLPTGEHFKTKLKTCYMKLQTILSKYSEEFGPESADERQEMDDDSTNQQADSPAEMIGVGPSYSLAFKQEYERMTNDPEVRNQNGCSPNEQQTIENESAEPVCIVLD